MLIFIPWWAWPLVAFFGGIVGAMFLTPRGGGPYDFGPALIAMGWLLGGTMLAIGLIVGHFT